MVPCYNEERRLPLDAFSAFLDAGGPVHFLFVNDGSRDGTLAMLEGLRAQFPHQVAVLDKQPNGGKAEAVRVGMLEALTLEGTAVTGFWDADLATPLQSIPELLARMVERPEVEMIFGARVRLMGRHIYRKAARHYLGRVFATVASKMLRMGVYDTQCGAKLFRVTPGLKQILTEPFQSRWIFDVEILARYKQLHRLDPDHIGRAVYEYPLMTWTDVGGSHVRPLDFFKAGWELLRIWRLYVAGGGTR